MPDRPTALVERHGRVALVTLHRPEALNALDAQLMQDVTGACAELDADPGVGCIVLTGSARAFAAGADIKELQHRTFEEMDALDPLSGWDALTRVRTPLVAAVAGHALGGGCELAMLCDLIVAADTARFGQPEVHLGVIPGLGGTQRLARAVGKAKAMDLCLTGRTMDAEEAERSGLVARVVPAERLLPEALALAAVIAEGSAPITRLLTEAIDRAEETSLAEGLRFERRAFHATFATQDRREGMAAFVEKRPPSFTHR